MSSVLAALEARLRQDFLAGSAFTIADIAAYMEVSQCLPAYGNLADLAPYPRIRNWLERCASQRGHDEVMGHKDARRAFSLLRGDAKL